MDVLFHRGGKLPSRFRRGGQAGLGKNSGLSSQHLKKFENLSLRGLAKELDYLSRYSGMGVLNCRRYGNLYETNQIFPPSS